MVLYFLMFLRPGITNLFLRHFGHLPARLSKGMRRASNPTPQSCPEICRGHTCLLYFPYCLRLQLDFVFLKTLYSIFHGQCNDGVEMNQRRTLKKNQRNNKIIFV